MERGEPARSLDADGLVADVLFPDDQSANSPPFLWFAREHNRPWEKEYSPELKLAGARAYNRWLADYCSSAPDRLLGFALVEVSPTLMARSSR